MTLKVTDLFCGAGGASLAAEATGKATLVMAANHWSRAIDVHQANFPEARHDLADISQVDFRRYPPSDILIAGCECTNHSQGKGVSRKRQQASLFEGPDPGAERSRATMWDPIRYVEIHQPAAVIVENVVDAHNWVYWDAWMAAWAAAGYRATVKSLNSMHFGVPQSRDRIYIVLLRNGIVADLDYRPQAACGWCETVVEAYQAWKPMRSIGKYRHQYDWRCTACHNTVEPAVVGADAAIDWSLPGERIGDRAKPLADKTLRRIEWGISRYGVTVVAGAGNTWERPGSEYRRAWPATAPMPTQSTTNQHGIACPPFIAELRGGGSKARAVTEPMATVEAGGNHHMLIEPPAFYVKNYGDGTEKAGQMVHPTSDPLGTITSIDHHALLVPYYRTGRATLSSQPMPTVTTRDRVGVVQPELVLDDCTYRMFEPHEVGAGMAFPATYRVDGTKRDRIRLYGNAWTPPPGTWLVGRVAEALEAAA